MVFVIGIGFGAHLGNKLMGKKTSGSKQTEKLNGTASLSGGLGRMEMLARGQRDNDDSSVSCYRAAASFIKHFAPESMRIRFGGAPGWPDRGGGEPKGALVRGLVGNGLQSTSASCQNLCPVVGAGETTVVKTLREGE